jgi:hypothetical protein
MFALLILLGVASTTGFSFGSRTVGVNVHGDVTALKMVNVLRSLNHFNFQSVELAPLPYDYKALEPVIGEQTLKIHHGKHHAK